MVFTTRTGRNHIIALCKLNPKPRPLPLPAYQKRICIREAKSNFSPVCNQLQPGRLRPNLKVRFLSVAERNQPRCKGRYGGFSKKWYVAQPVDAP